MIGKYFMPIIIVMCSLFVFSNCLRKNLNHHVLINKITKSGDIIIKPDQNYNKPEMLQFINNNIRKTKKLLKRTLFNFSNNRRSINIVGFITGIIILIHFMIPILLIICLININNKANINSQDLLKNKKNLIFSN